MKTKTKIPQKITEVLQIVISVKKETIYIGQQNHIYWSAKPYILLLMAHQTDINWQEPKNVCTVFHATVATMRVKG